MMNSKFLYTILIALLMLSCKPEETPLPAREIPAELMSNQVNMESDYSKQLWFSIAENKVVASNPKNTWDLAFDCRSGVERIYLNSAMFMRVAKTNQSDFASITSAAGYDFKPDHPTGNTDSLAFGKTPELNKVYIIDRGYDVQGRSLGHRKLLLTAMDANSYTVRYAALNGDNEQTITVVKKSAYAYNQIALSLETHDVRTIEPQSVAWDLCFTQYTHVFYDPYMPYLVTGLVINPMRIQVAMSEEVAFDDMNKEKAHELQYSSATDAIGYDWKEYSFDTGAFTVYSNKIYVIKTSENIYYKWRFIDFYDQNGIKGNPKFEFMRL